MVGIDWRSGSSLPVLDHRIPLAAAPAPVQPFAMGGAWLPAEPQLALKLAEENAEIARNGQVSLHRGFVQFGRIHINLNLERSTREGAPVVADLADVQPRAQH